MPWVADDVVISVMGLIVLSSLACTGAIAMHKVHGEGRESEWSFKRVSVGA